MSAIRVALRSNFHAVLVRAGRVGSKCAKAQNFSSLRVLMKWRLSKRSMLRLRIGLHVERVYEAWMRVCVCVGLEMIHEISRRHL